MEEKKLSLQVWDYILLKSYAINWDILFLLKVKKKILKKVSTNLLTLLKCNI